MPWSRANSDEPLAVSEKTVSAFRFSWRARSARANCGFLANPHVGMAQERAQFGHVPAFHPFAEQSLNLRDDRVVRHVGGRELVDASLAGLVPSLDPVSDVQGAIGAEIDVGGLQAPEEFLGVDHPVRGPARLDGERADAAVAGGASEVGQKEVMAQSLGQAGPGIIRQAGRSVADVDQGGDEVKGRVFRLGIPEFFRVPGASAVRFLDELVPDPPAAVPSFHEVDQPGAVAAVGVVIDAEQVAVLVERQFLWVPQPGGDDLQFRPVRIAAQDGAAIELDEVFLVDRRDVQPAVADAEVQLSVRAEGQAVEVVPEKSDVHTVAVLEDLPLVGLAVAVVVL